MKKLLKLGAVLSVLLLVGCATQKPVQVDYTAFKESKPRSILVLPPLNETTDVKATYSVLSQVTYPLAEAGYYVFPVALVDETFKQNGLTLPAEMHTAPPEKLQSIFGADTALYMTVTRFGTTYTVLDSVTYVALKAKLVDLRSGAVLWQNSAAASSGAASNPGGGLAGLIAMAVIAAAKQVANTVSDQSYDIAGLASNNLLSGGRFNGILYGPRARQYVPE